MLDQRIYLSIMTVPASSGSITLTLETLDATENTTLVAEVTGITSGATVDQVAKLVVEQTNSLLSVESASYNKIPIVGGEDTPATFQLTRTEHIVCFWSQAQFTLTYETDTGLLAHIGSKPVYTPCDSARDTAGDNDIDLTAMSDEQLIRQLVKASANLCSRLKNNIVVSTYLAQRRGDGKANTYLRPPVLSYDKPSIKRKYPWDQLWVPGYTAEAYNIKSDRGDLYFRFDEIDIEMYGPFSRDNEIRISYISGYNTVPEEIRTAIVLLVDQSQIANDGLTSLAGGSFKATFNEKFDPQEKIFQFLTQYKLRRRY